MNEAIQRCIEIAEIRNTVLWFRHRPGGTWIAGLGPENCDGTYTHAGPIISDAAEGLWKAAIRGDA